MMMKGSIANALQRDKIYGQLDLSQMPAAGKNAYADMRQKVREGKYWYVPHVSALCNSNAGAEIVDIFLCPESERPVIPIVSAGNGGGPGVPASAGKNFLGISLVDSGYQFQQGRPKALELAVHDVVVPFGYFLRGVEMQPAGTGADASGIIHLEYMFVELDECESYY